MYSHEQDAKLRLESCSLLMLQHKLYKMVLNIEISELSKFLQLLVQNRFLCPYFLKTQNELYILLNAFLFLLMTTYPKPIRIAAILLEW